MKFGQLIEYNKGNIFLKKSNTKCDGETSPRYFSEKLGLSISLNQGFIKFVFVVCQDDGYGNVLKLADHILLPRIKLFLKNEKRSGTSLPASFSA